MNDRKQIGEQSLKCFKQALSDLKRRQAGKLERLLNQNEERLARVEQENQVLKSKVAQVAGCRTWGRIRIIVRMKRD